MPINETTSPRRVFIQLLMELPADRVVHTTMSKKWTAAAMVAEVEQGTEAGLLYISDFFRIVRDFMTRNVSDK